MHLSWRSSNANHYYYKRMCTDYAYARRRPKADVPDAVYYNPCTYLTVGITYYDDRATIVQQYGGVYL